MTDEKKDALMPCRESFEMWLTANGDYPHLAHKHFGGGYLHDEAAMKWDAWKGAWNTRAQPVADDAGGDELDVHDRLRHMTDDFKMSQHQCRHQSEQISALQVELAQAKAALRQPPAVYDPNLSVPDHVIESAQILRIWAANQGHEKWQVMGIGPVDHTPAADNRGVDVEATMSINAIQKAAGVLYDQLQPYMNAKSLGHAPIFMAYSTIMEQTMDLRGLLRTTPEDAKGDEKPEWFFRWAARAMAGHTPYENAISTIFNHPGNPYAENNPWASPQPEHEGEKG